MKNIKNNSKKNKVSENGKEVVITPHRLKLPPRSRPLLEKLLRHRKELYPDAIDNTYAELMHICIKHKLQEVENTREGLKYETIEAQRTVLYPLLRKS